MTSNGGGVTDDRANALLKAGELDAATERSAYITLADVALRVADGDGQAARETLAMALEAAGAIPYEPKPGRKHFGQVRES